MKKIKDDNNQKDFNIVKKNVFNSAKMKISLMEYRIILLAMSKINPKINNYKDIEFTAQDFYEIFEDEEKTYNKNYNNIRKACKDLLSRVVEIKNDKGITIIQWFSKAVLPYNSNKIYLSFHDDVSPFICYLITNQDYTKYLLSNVSKIKSLYAIRIYELLKEEQYKGTRLFKIEDLREILGLPKNKYKLYADFKKRIIDYAKEELIKTTDLYFTYTENKTNRRVSEINFKILKNNKKESNEFKKYNKFELIHILNNLLADKLTIRLYTDNLEILHRMVIIDLIKFIRDGSFANIKSPYAFVEKEIDNIMDRYDLTKVEDY